MNQFSQFYTEEIFSQLLVDSLDIVRPNIVLDLGVGHGSLVKAAYNRWGITTSFICADIDKSNVKKITSEYPFINVHHANGLKMDIERSLCVNKETVDIAVCNPPYQFVKEKGIFERLFDSVGLGDCLNLKKLTSDIVFLAQNMRMLKEHGELGIILPDSVLTGKDFWIFRKAILDTYKIKTIIQLPSNVFSKTEAKTHIVLLRKERPDDGEIPLFISGRNGKCYGKITVGRNNLEDRMDYSFHSYKIRNPNNKKKLSDCSIQVLRGNVTHHEIRSSKSSFIHSTSFKSGEIISVDNARVYKKYVMANPGDLLIVRVGRGCVGKVAMIKKGSLPITDCIYVLKGSSKVITRIYKFLSSPAGKEWIEANAHGVCAKVLSKGDILNLPV